MKKGILLINLGTPDSPSVKDVRKYLREFLMDGRVIDLPFLQRWLLVNLIIATFRAPKSAKAYQKLWTKNGSPLLYYGKTLKSALQQELGETAIVELGMRYGNPSIKSALNNLKIAGIDELQVIPLYPQYASSSTGSSIEKVMSLVQEWNTIPSISFVSNFFDQPEFIRAFAETGKKYLEKENYDFILFSYHGIPERHVIHGDTQGGCNLNQSCCSIPSNKYCYRAQCFQTTALIVKELGLKEEQYATVFQSRLKTRVKEPWLRPYTDEAITDLAKNGKKKLLVFSPAFVADCLETIVEIGMEYQELFEKHGGEKIQLVESLNERHEMYLPLIRG